MASRHGRIGILVGGGPAPGINSVISAAVIEAVNSGRQAIGIMNGYEFLVKGDTSQTVDLGIPDVSTIHTQGGSILHTSRTNPTRRPEDLETCVATLEKLGIGTEEGARLTFGGHQLRGSEFDEGYYVEPTIFTDVRTDMRIAREEIFGPVLCDFRVSGLQEAVRISNDVEFGLSSSVYTSDLVRAHEYINTAETGMVHVNAQTLGGEVHLPFGGLGASGTGQREQGTEGFDFFTETISVYIDHSAGAKERSKFI